MLPTGGMMSLKEQLNLHLKDAMKSRDATRCGVLRMLKAAILEAEVALRSKRGKDYQLSDEEVLEVITRYTKQRAQSIEAYESGNRPDLAAKEKKELGILKEYLPEQLTAEALEAIVAEVIEKTGASSVRDLGKVMGGVMPRVKGAADGNAVREIAQRLLG